MTFITDGSCTDSCGVGFYNNGAGFCLECAVGCSECTDGVGSTNCLSCENGYTKNDANTACVCEFGMFTWGVYCLPACPTTTYP